MKSKPIFILLTSIIVAFLTVQLSPTPAISGGKWRSVPADETRIVLKGWPEQNQFKYRKGWHSDNWAMECEQSYNTQGLHKTTIQLCRMLPGFYYQAAAGKNDISEYSFWNWTTWKGSKIKNGQDTALKFEDPRVFRHLYFTQYENECQFMTHAREAGSERYTAAREGQPDFRPIVTVMTCNTDEKFQESSFKIDDANGKVIISYPGQQKSSLDVVSILLKKHEIPLHSKDIHPREKCNDRYEEKVVTGIHTSLAYWIDDYTGRYQCWSGSGIQGNLALCSEKANERATAPPVKCKIYAIHESSSGKTYTGKEEILARFAPDKITASTTRSEKYKPTTKSEKYKPTTNFTSSDTKTSVTSNTDKRSIPFAAHWEAKSGVLLGVLNYPKAGDAGSLSASSGDISCQGTWQRAGQGAENGTWSIACSDGRTASGFYKMHEVGKGTGTGTDPDGNKVEVTWGG